MLIHIFRQLGDLIFPPSESMRILRAHEYVSALSYYAPHVHAHTTALSHYQEPFIKAAITAGKFEHNIVALKKVSPLLAHYLDQTTQNNKSEHIIIVPIPLHPRREYKRGYNQVTVIANHAIKGTPVRVTPLLKKVTHTNPQSHKKRSERLKQLATAFAYQKQPVDWSQVTRVILLDDVVTTGSTMKAAATTLRHHLPRHVKLECVAIAH